VRRVAAPRAKYGDESVYFDLKDIGNTSGAWDLYGSDGKSPYNGLQVSARPGPQEHRHGPLARVPPAGCESAPRGDSEYPVAVPPSSLCADS